MDVLSEVLRTVRLEGALFFTGDFHEPWCIEVPTGADLARELGENATALAVVHLVLEGRAWARLKDGTDQPLDAGDIAVFSHGHCHVLGAGRGSTPARIDDVIRPSVPELRTRRYGGQGARTRIACGWFAFERGPLPPLAASLPAMFVASITHRRAGDWLQSSIRYALEEAASGSPGSRVIAAKIAEALFVEALRAHAESLPPGCKGWLSGLRDPCVGRCLSLLHERPGHPWTLPELARRTRTSRSALASRFVAYVGVPPMQYLKHWRLARAAQLLGDERWSLAQVAEQVGYESEAAFNRAFKSAHGVPPGRWRRAGRAAPAPANPTAPGHRHRAAK